MARASFHTGGAAVSFHATAKEDATALMDVITVVLPPPGEVAIGPLESPEVGVMLT